MKKTILTMALAIALGAFMPTAKAVNVEKTIPVTGSFDKISSIGSMEVIYAQGSKHTVKIIGTAEDVEKVKVKVKNGKLSFEPETSTRKLGGVTITTTSFKDDVKIKVTSPKLCSVNIIGSGDFTANGTVKTDKLNLDIAGSGDIDIKKVAADKLTANVAGSGEIDLENISACDDVNLTVAGSGEIEANLNNCKNVRCNVAGSGEIKVKGKVTNYYSSVAGTGEIDRRELVATGNVSESTSKSSSSRNNRTNTVNGIIAEP